MDNRRDARSFQALEQGLNREAETLSPQIQQRLEQARQKALLVVKQQHPTQAQTRFAAWLGSWSVLTIKPRAVLAGLVGAMVLSLGLQLGFDHSSDKSLSNSELSTKNSADVLMSNEDIEFLDNMDIYEWLAAEYS